MRNALRSTSLLASLTLALGLQADAGLAKTKAAAPHAVPQYTIEDFLATTNMSGASFSPDHSKVLVSSDATGVINVYAVPVTGGEPVQLTKSTTNACMSVGYFPNDERVLYSSDQGKGGNELTHIYAQAPDGSVTDVTPGDSLKAQFVDWADDDKSFLVTTNQRDHRYFDLYEIAVDGYTPTLLYKNETGYDLSEVSRDKRYVALTKVHTELNSDIYVYDRQTQEMKHVTPHEGDVSNTPASFSPDGKSLYIMTDEGSEFQYLARHDLTTGQRTVVEKPKWDVLFAGFSRHGKYLVVAINNDARTQIKLYEAATMKPVALPTMPNGEIGSVRISPDEKAMAFYVNSSRSPNNLFVYDFKTGKPLQLTQNLSPKIDPANLVDAQVVRFKSYDGVEVPGILYKPHQASAQAKAPALVNVHGGPGGQSRVGYSAIVQYLVNHGYAVYSINNRGSSGYGKTFFQMDDHKHGDKDLDDCVESKKFLVATGYVDPGRIGIMGGSYGGYMVLAALAFRPEAFNVGVDLFGVANWVRTLNSIPKWWESQREALYKEMGNPATDDQYLHDISPMFHASNIKRPLIVLQGANDPRVLKVESDEMVAAVKANGVPVEYIVFDDEGHGFRKKANQAKGYKAVLDYVDKYLKNGPATGVAER